MIHRPCGGAEAPDITSAIAELSSTHACTERERNVALPKPAYIITEYTAGTTTKKSERGRCYR